MQRNLVQNRLDELHLLQLLLLLLRSMADRSLTVEVWLVLLSLVSTVEHHRTSCRVSSSTLPAAIVLPRVLLLLLLLKLLLLLLLVLLPKLLLLLPMGQVVAVVSRWVVEVLLLRIAEGRLCLLTTRA